MDKKEKIINAIFMAIDEVNEKLPREHRIEKSPQAPWLGPASRLDSMGLIFLIVAIEKKIKEKLGVDIKIANEKMIFLQDSPLQNADRLASHISLLLR